MRHGPSLFLLTFIGCLAMSLQGAEATTSLSMALDPAMRHRACHQWELNPYGGSYLGRHLGQTWTAGARGRYHVNETWALGAHYGYVRNRADASGAYGQSLTTRDIHMVSGEVLISNDAALRLGRRMVEMDFYLTVGAGSMQLNAVWEPMGVLGGGVKLYPRASWYAVVIDVNNYAHMTPRPQGARFDVDTTFTGGFSFLWP
ncbi:MAG: hypothetical protein HYV02_01185 [Deltaproteobacteria bacterium]|nr:hypothetical protein [Deltaproteobacteria bacterium]